MSTEQRPIFIGKITRTHGVRGELKVLEAEGASGAWREASRVWIGPDAAQARAFRVRRVRAGGRFVILALEDVDRIEQAQQLAGQRLFVPRDELPACEEGTYYADDLLGLEVVDQTGRSLGELDGIFDNGAHEIYAVRNGSEQLLLPIVDGVVCEVDLANRRLVVCPPEGLVPRG